MFDQTNAQVIPRGENDWLAHLCRAALLPISPTETVELYTSTAERIDEALANMDWLVQEQESQLANHEGHEEIQELLEAVSDHLGECQEKLRESLHLMENLDILLNYGLKRYPELRGLTDGEFDYKVTKLKPPSVESPCRQPSNLSS